MADQPALPRRTFLKRAAALGAGAALAEVLAPAPRRLEAAEPTGPTSIIDPFKVFPDRGWESTYRDLFKTDSSFVFTCAPNDTHDCLLRASVKNGVIVNINPTYGYGKAEDLHGNRASHRWDPRCCQKGLALARRFYGDRRVQGAMVRKGWKEWVEAGFPRDPDTGRALMDTNRRGEDAWLKVKWDEALDLAAKAYMNITATYSGPEGADRLRKQGYDPDMVTALEGAGTRTAKMRGGMPLLGITRIFGFYRFANMLALLDVYNRKVDINTAKGSRAWDNYAWHTDLPPGHPMVTGQQTIDHDLFAAEHSSLVVMLGMNWIATKMPDGHWLSEARAKGTKVITVSTDYQSSSNKADEVILIRPGTDAALAYGCVQYIFANKLADEEHLKRFTDLPLLVRMDNHKLLAAKDIQEGYTPAKLENYIQLLADGQALPLPSKQAVQYVPAALRDDWGDFVVWDTRGNGPKTVNRDQVGERFTATGVNAALTGTFTVRTVDGASVTVRPVYDLLKAYLDDNFDLQTTSEITWAPKEAIASLAKQVAAACGKTCCCPPHGAEPVLQRRPQGPGVAAAGRGHDNIGHIGGNAGSFAATTAARSSTACRSGCWRTCLTRTESRSARPHPALPGRVGALLQLRRPGAASATRTSPASPTCRRRRR
ncbi:MAG: molybdopterin-dependent oxidoreductase [Dehalococcoidia bacterium]